MLHRVARKDGLRVTNCHYRPCSVGGLGEDLGRGDFDIPWRSGEDRSADGSPRFQRRSQSLQGAGAQVGRGEVLEDSSSASYSRRTVTVPTTVMTLSSGCSVRSLTLCTNVAS